MRHFLAIYRLSDKGEKKEKLSYVNNKSCLENFLEHFPSSSVYVVADNVCDETYYWLSSLPLAGLCRTALGNSGSFFYSYEIAIQQCNECVVYFVENDYIHRAGSFDALFDGIRIADYVTLYDHPDKYIDGPNPLVKGGGEVSKVFLSSKCHWKITNSTTMTFAAKVSTLKKDRLFFKFFTIGLLPHSLGSFGNRFLGFLQARPIPNDYKIFRTLSLIKRRTVVSPMPSFSTHGESRFLCPFFSVYFRVDFED